jgi:hypothetical protein
MVILYQVQETLRPCSHKLTSLHMETAPMNPRHFWLQFSTNQKLLSPTNHLATFHVLYHISIVYLIKLEQVFSTTKSTQHYPEEI